MDYFDIFTTDVRNNAIFLPTFLFQGKSAVGRGCPEREPRAVNEGLAMNVCAMCSLNFGIACMWCGHANYPNLAIVGFLESAYLCTRKTKDTIARRWKEERI